MCNYSKREQAMVVVRPGVHCDPCLVPLVRALYENGFPTVASCCGHGERPASVALADGRWVFLATPEQRETISAAFADQDREGNAERELEQLERTLDDAADFAEQTPMVAAEKLETERDRAEAAEAKVKEVEGERDEAHSSAEHHRAKAQRYEEALREILTKKRSYVYEGPLGHNVETDDTIALAAFLLGGDSSGWLTADELRHALARLGFPMPSSQWIAGHLVRMCKESAPRFERQDGMGYGEYRVTTWAETGLRNQWPGFVAARGGPLPTPKPEGIAKGDTDG